MKLHRLLIIFLTVLVILIIIFRLNQNGSVLKLARSDEIVKTDDINKSLTLGVNNTVHTVEVTSSTAIEMQKHQAPTESIFDVCYKQLVDSVLADQNAKFEFENKLKSTMASFFGDRFYDPQASFETNASDVQKFFYAMALSDLLINGPSQLKPNKLLALKLLKEVYTSNPTNSAPLAYMAVIYQELNQEDEVKKLINMISTKTSVFDNFTLKVNRAIYKLLISPKDYIFVNDALMLNAPEIKSDKLIKLISGYKLTGLAEQMMADGLNPENNHPGLNWNLGQYVIGCVAYRKASAQNSCMSAVELSLQKQAKYNEHRNYPALDVNCDLKEFETAVEEAKAELKKLE